jgi:hypothetical protein
MSFLQDDERPMTDTEYAYEVFNAVSEDIISDEYFDRNKGLLFAISNELFELNVKSGKIPPERATRIIEGVFSSINKHGLR